MHFNSNVLVLFGGEEKMPGLCAGNLYERIHFQVFSPGKVRWKLSGEGVLQNEFVTFFKKICSIILEVSKKRLPLHSQSGK